MDGIVTNTSAKAAAEAWLRDFGAALASGETDRVAALFADDCHWRDILAFTWDLRATSGAASIAQRMATAISHNGAARVGTCPGPHAAATCHARRRRHDRGDLRLRNLGWPLQRCRAPGLRSQRATRAWTLMTTLDEIRGHEDPPTAGAGRMWIGSATSAGRTGSTGASGHRHTRTAIPPSSWWARRRPGCPSPLG